MAILISKSDTASFTNNEWYRVEASNPTMRSATYVTLTTTALAIPVTFANAGNCRGLTIALNGTQTQRVTTMKDVIVELEELVAAVWTVRASKTLTTTQVSTGISPQGTWITPFEFTTPYAVNTTAGIWRFTVRSGALLSTHYRLATSNATAPFYLAWCDTQLTPVSGSDMLVAKNYVDMNSSFTLKAHLGTGETVSGVSAIACRNLDPTPDNVAYFRCLTPLAPYTLTLDGLFILSNHGGFRLGTSSLPIPVVNRFKISLANATVGSSINSQFTDQPNALGVGGRFSFFAYGGYPANQLTTLTADVSVGATSMTVTNASFFAVNDYMTIGKRSTETDSGLMKYLVTSVVGNTINFTPSLASTTAISGGYVLKGKNSVTNLSGFGIEITRVEGASNSVFNFINYAGMPNNFICEGTYFQLAGYAGSGFSIVTIDESIYTNQLRFKNCLFVNNIIEQSYSIQFNNFISAITLPIKGIYFENVYFTRSGPINGITNGSQNSIGFPAQLFIGGPIELYNIYSFGLAANNTSMSILSNAKFIVDRYYMDNSSAGSAGLTFSGYDSSYKNVTIWNSRGDANAGALTIGAMTNGTFTNLKINRSNVGIWFFGSNSNITFTNTIFGDETANTVDISNIAKSYISATFKTVTGNPIIGTSYPNSAESSYINFENKNGTNIDSQIQPLGEIVRTGTGLADTVVHTAGGYGLRFQPKSSTTATYWTQNIPTGNIQNLTMTVGVWIKMNNAAYWAGANQMPRLTVSYDNGVSSSFAEAAKTTDWQFVFLAITPTTTFGQITFTIDGKTDASGSNAYFYIDDFSAPLPQGSTLNLGKLDLFSNGLPVGPANFATTVTAADVWAADPSLFGASTVGDKVNKIKNDTALIPAVL